MHDVAERDSLITKRPAIVQVIDVGLYGEHVMVESYRAFVMNNYPVHGQNSNDYICG